MTKDEDQIRQKEMRVYVDALAGPPNGWGQHIINGYGPSHYYLDYLNGKWGKATVTAWLAAYYDSKGEVK
jgi:hypothetical protein